MRDIAVIRGDNAEGFGAFGVTKVEGLWTVIDRKEQVPVGDPLSTYNEAMDLAYELYIRNMYTAA